MNKITFLQKFTACFVAGLILVAICLVLGRSFPPSWVIPEVVFGFVGFFLLTSLIYPIIWQRKEKKQTANSSKILAFWQGVIRYGLAFDIAHFGWKKVFLQQFITPYVLYDEKLGNLSGEWLTWNYFGFSYGFGLIVASIQIGGSILLLFQKTRLLGFVLLLPVLLNILFINYFYGLNAGALLQSIVLSLGLLYLLFIDYGRLVAFFLQSKDTLQNINLGNNFIKNSLRFSMIFIPFLLAFSVYYSYLMPPNIRGAYEVKSQSNAKTDTISSVNIEARVYKKVYFDRNNDCIVEYNKGKLYGNYNFDNVSNEVTITFGKPDSSILKAKVKRVENSENIIISGNWDKQAVELELLRLK
jgi:hypothetical protein